MKYHLQGKVVVITGAGCGMGREMALAPPGTARSAGGLRLERRGARRHRRAGSRTLGAEVRSDEARRLRPRRVATCAAAVAEQFGSVNVVVNNAGVTVSGDFEEMEYADFDWIVGVNF